jgi:hypothetical protein
MKVMFPIPDYIRQPAAYFHTRILVGPGAFLTPAFANERNITHVINCAFDGDSPKWWRNVHSNRYMCMNAIDSPFHNILNWYPKFEETMKRFLREGNGVVYVHCQAGMNRSASLALAYVVKNFHQPFHPFKMAVLRQRPCMFQNVVFMNQVEEFINGCVSSEKDTRVDNTGDSNRDAGLNPQGNDSNTQRLVVSTRQPSHRTE